METEEHVDAPAERAASPEAVEKPLSKVVQPEPKKRLAVEREKVCPFLLRIFTKNNQHHRIEEFTPSRFPSNDELQIYTWRDATLRELATLLQEVDIEARRRDVSMSFQLMKLNPKGFFTAKDLGTVSNARPSSTDDLMLDDIDFVIGDYIDVAIRRDHGHDRRRDHAGPPQDRDRDRDRNRNRDRAGRGRW